MSKYKILSLDGGGIRGLITSILIKKLDDKTGFLKNVDLFSGTSTGGIISIALASGAPIEEVVQIYDDPESCKKIFKRYHPKNLIDRLLYFLKQLFQFNFGQILHVKYTDEGLKERLIDVLGQPKPLSDLERHVLVTTFQLDSADIDGWRPISLSSLDNTSNVLNLDAALSTSAAPTYFPPHYIQTLGYLTDGGTFANNPCMFALAKALQANDHINRDDVTVLSIGTGYASARVPETAIKNPYNCGYLFWLKGGNGVPSLPILGMLFDGATSEKDTFECNQILGDSYLRLNPMLHGEISLDSYKDIPKLQKIAEDFAVDSNPEWVNAIKWVEKNFC
ncbi:MAG: patatin-like phospholipase family protein [Caldisericia bacterium]